MFKVKRVVSGRGTCEYGEAHDGLSHKQWRRSMTVNCLTLPDPFVALIDQPEPTLWWIPKGGDERWVYRGGEGGAAANWSRASTMAESSVSPTPWPASPRTCSRLV